MITEFGKILRKLRKDKDLLLQDMANDIKVSLSYLSLIERGKKEAPISLVEDIVVFYGIDFETSTRMHAAAIVGEVE